jgi:hypothetical protein
MGEMKRLESYEADQRTSGYVGTSAIYRRSAVENYWRHCDPHYCDGPNVESFTELLRRIEGCSPGSSICPDGSRVFSRHC